MDRTDGHTRPRQPDVMWACGVLSNLARLNEGSESSKKTKRNNHVVKEDMKKKRRT